eukprot:TRINITY_DN12163_c0_g1_i1.p2 TRINITY_DN12163_c0_g1~~TRINITY_DN12163_c0_g1_i1.p2  ORF type:complete len:128 (-),score=25.10 TRINITY_DN12163_c0_g1_i1:58-441(-)
MVRVFITTFSTSANGVDLQTARNVVMAEAVYNPAVMWQAEDRAYRLGQKRDVHVYYLQSCSSGNSSTQPSAAAASAGVTEHSTRETLERFVFHVLARKQQTIRETIEGGAVGLDLQSIKCAMYAAQN